MKNNFYYMLIAFFGLTLTIVSCNNDDDFNPPQVLEDSIINLSFEGDNIAEVNSVELEFKETNTGTVIIKELDTKPYTVRLPKGSYNATVNAQVVLTSGETLEAAGLSSFDLTEETQDLRINLSLKAFSEDFIIEEVFFTGVKTSEGKNYNSGRYFKLTNNTNKTLNTGGLLIMKSQFNPSLKYDVQPDIRSNSFAVSGVLMIPLEIGKEVEPGDFIVIADMAINHHTSNIPAYDLSNADYEYPNLDNPALGQTDNPAVPNANVIYTTMNFNMFFLHNRGLESYAIARFPENVSVNSWLNDYVYNYEYLNAAGNITQKSTYKVPNEWILDGVNCAIPTNWEWNPLDASIDASYTSVGTINSDPSRFGKTVRRKIIGTMVNGKPVYKDTNDSDIDFVKSSDSSLANGIIH
ncbi:DUF4876 domain-containing protein [Flavobacteriaceae bacterium Ap0902]|nr:DUF4876 domain-containing protein [Flavobacteriaceae bacterium Ap0902]